jgi:predicted nucleic acid-binding protein
MRFVIDASVGVAAARHDEDAHLESQAFLRHLFESGAELWLPPLFQIEVVASLCRRGIPLAIAEAYVGTILKMPANVVTVGPRAAKDVQTAAAFFGLRGADALYAWLARKKRAILVSLDREHLKRVPFAKRPRAAFSL